MKKAMKAKWIEALRSGKYKQGNGALKKKCDGYCCLGVLAAISGCTWRGFDCDRMRPFKNGKLVGYTGKNMEDDGCGYLKSDFAGLPIQTQKKLAQMNDGGGIWGSVSSFKKIADYVEKHIRAS